MKLANVTVDNILEVIASFDRERGVPHDYHDLEVILRNTNFVQDPTGELVIAKEQPKAPGEPVRPGGASHSAARVDTALDDGIEGKEMLMRAAREWLD